MHGELQAAGILLACLASKGIARVSLHMVGHTVLVGLMIEKDLRQVDSLAVAGSAIEGRLDMDFEDNIGDMVTDRSCLVFPFAISTVHTRMDVPVSLYHTGSRKYSRVPLSSLFSVTTIKVLQ